MKLPPLLRSAACWTLLLALAGLLRPTAGYLSTNSDTCSLPMAPQFLALPRCQPTTKTLEDAKAVAWRFAPIVYMHPLEAYHLQSPPVWYEASEIYYQDYKNSTDTMFGWFDNSQTNQLMFMPRSFATLLNNSWISTDQRNEVIAGAPKDPATNRSTADVYYTVQEVPESPGLWMYSYNLYYAWNGCSNQDLAISIDGDREVVQYLVCPFGVHEGDWERISVLVCAEDLTIQQTAYSQHGWWETRDCTQPGQCTLEQDGNVANETVLHPVTHSALDSHANYYEESPLIFYAWKNATFKGVGLENLGGVWVGDRTLKDPNWKWEPTPANVKHLPNMTEIQALPAAEQEQWDWAKYPGNWGAPLASQKTKFFCYNDNQTVLDACPDTTATRMLTTAFALLDVVNTLTGGGGGNSLSGTADFPYVAKNGGNNSWVGAGSITGPLFRTWTYQWLPERHAPIFDDFPNNNTVLNCPQTAVITADYPDPSNFETSTTIDTIINYLVGICIGALLLSVVIVLMMSLPNWVSKSANTPNVLLAYSKKAVCAGGGMLARAGDAVTESVAGGMTASSSWRMPTLGFSGSQPLDVAAAPAAPEQGAATHGSNQAAEQAAPDEKQAAAGAAGVAAGPSEKEMQLRAGGHASNTPFAVYSFVAFALYIAAVVLLALGTNQLVQNSAAAFAAHISNNTGALTAVKWLIIGDLIVTGCCDLLAVFVILVAHRPRISLGKWSIRNYLYSEWVNEHAYKWHIATCGLIMLVISIAAILFGLGLVVTMVQLAVRLMCSQVADATINGVSTDAICITVPSFTEGSICGWQVMEVCYEITNMGVLMLLLGAMLLLWSHVIWMIVLLLSMWRFQKWKIVRVDSSGDLDSPASSDLASPATSIELPPVHKKGGKAGTSALDEERGGNGALNV